MADEVADVLRRMILVGDLTPGQRMTQDELATMLNVSTTPVREALLKLSASGLIEASPNRFFRVAQTTPDDVRDTYWVHAALAGELTRRACERQDQALLNTLRDIERSYQHAVDSADGPTMSETNWRFHRAINQAAASPRLVFMLKVTIRFIPDDLYADIESWGTTSVDSHRNILAAFDERDADAAQTAASEHVLEAGELLVQHLGARGFWRATDDGVVEASTTINSASVGMDSHRRSAAWTTPRGTSTDETS
jgi:DNA-binding GntR family transcriptional regulator